VVLPTCRAVKARRSQEVGLPGRRFNSQSLAHPQGRIDLIGEFTQLAYGRPPTGACAIRAFSSGSRSNFKVTGSAICFKTEIELALDRDIDVGALPVEAGQPRQTIEPLPDRVQPRQSPGRRSARSSRATRNTRFPARPCLADTPPPRCPAQCPS
jgi:hypothetical protein